MRAARLPLTVEYVFYGQPLAISIKQFFHGPGSPGGNMLGSGAGGERFKSWASQIERRVANGSPPLRLFFERSCVAQAKCRSEVPRKLLTRLDVIQRV